MNAQEIKSKLSKMPKWIQDYVWSLENKLNRIEAHLETQDKTKISWSNDYTNYSFLPDRSSIRFELPNNEYIDVRLKEGKIYLNASHQLIIIPHVTNAVDVEVRR